MCLSPHLLPQLFILQTAIRPNEPFLGNGPNLLGHDDRIVRYHLMDNVRGTPDMWASSEVKKSAFTACIVGDTPDERQITFEGGFDMKSASGPRGYTGRIEGTITLNSHACSGSAHTRKAAPSATAPTIRTRRKAAATLPSRGWKRTTPSPGPCRPKRSRPRTATRPTTGPSEKGGIEPQSRKVARNVKESRLSSRLCAIAVQIAVRRPYGFG